MFPFIHGLCLAGLFPFCGGDFFVLGRKNGFGSFLGFVLWFPPRVKDADDFDNAVGVLLDVFSLCTLFCV